LTTVQFSAWAPTSVAVTSVIPVTDSAPPEDDRMPSVFPPMLRKPMIALTELPELIDEETELLRWCSQQPAGAEGIASFVEKRSPRWTGSPAVDMPPLWATTGPHG
jgi:hypothetical protein